MILNDDLFRLRLQSVQHDLMHDFTCMADEADCSIVLALPFLGSVMTKDWVHGVGPVCQILLQIVMSAVITASPPACASSAVMLSTPADFPFFSDCTAASTSLRRTGGRLLCLSGDSSILMDLHWSCDCAAQSSILSIGLVSIVLL